MTPRPALLTPDQVAERLTLPVSSVYRLIRRGDLQAHNVGTPRRPMYRVSEQQLSDYLSARLAVPA